MSYLPLLPELVTQQTTATGGQAFGRDTTTFPSGASYDFTVTAATQDSVTCPTGVMDVVYVSPTTGAVPSTPLREVVTGRGVFIPTTPSPASRGGVLLPSISL